MRYLYGSDGSEINFEEYAKGKGSSYSVGSHGSSETFFTDVHNLTTALLHVVVQRSLSLQMCTI